MTEKNITKRCSKCKDFKPLSEFYRNRTRKDSHKAYCKTCSKKYGHSKNGKTDQKRYNQSKKGKVNRRKNTRLFRIRHPVHIKAKNAVNHAIAAGKLLRPDTFQCSYCTNIAKQYHHHKGYEPKYWLDVVPTCLDCHRKCHRRIA